MGVIDWDNAMAVGIEEVDRQHRKLIDLLNQAFEASLAQDGEGGCACADCDAERMRELVGGMLDYADEHFATEEELMEQVGFSGIRAHKAAHAGFLDQARRFAENDASGARVEQVFSFLARWLREHILRMDRDFAPEVRRMRG